MITALKELPAFPDAWGGIQMADFTSSRKTLPA
jgi:hypothetical protein